MNQRRANVTVNVFAEKTAIYVLDDNNETRVSVSLDVSPIKVFVGDTNGDFVTYAEVIKLLNESDGVTTVHNAQRLGGFPADQYPRKAENALITGAWRHTGPLALGGNFLAAAALHNEGETILGGTAFVGGDVVSRGGTQAGFSGHGLWYRKEDNHLMIDNLTVRKAMRVYELIVNQIRGTNGSLWVSDTVKIVSAEETATVWRCFIDTNDASSIVPFREGDLIRSQRWTGKGVKYYSSKVVATATDFFELDKETWDGLDIPEAEDVLVRFGNVDDQDRQGALYLTSSDTDAPYMDVIDGVDSFDLAGKTKVRLGKLNGIFYNTEQLSGYGLYAGRALLTGAIRNLHGQWALNEDGSGILAGGAIEWKANGELTIGSRNPAEYALDEDVQQFIQETDGELSGLQTYFTALDEDQQTLYQDLQEKGQQIVLLDGKVLAVMDETGQLSDDFGIMDGKIVALGEIVSGHAASIQTLNGSIPHINNTIAGIENDVEGINSQVAEALGGVSQLNTDFSGVSADIEAIHEFNDELLAEINGLANRKNTRFISATEPVLPEGEEFSIGDEWLQEIEVPIEGSTEVTIEYKSWMWFGNSWQPNETKINGARIETGTIDAASIITESLFSKKIGGVELNVVSGNIGGFTIDDRLVAENDAGQGLIIDPSARSITLNDMVEGYGVSRIAMTAKGLTEEARISNGGGNGFSATVPSDEYNIRMPGNALVNSNNTVAGVSFVQYIGKASDDQAEISSSSTQTSGFPVNLNTSYTFDLPYSFRIYHDGGDRNGRKNKLHGNLRVSVTASLMGVNSSGVSKPLITPIPVQTLITRSTNDTEVFMRPIAVKTSFYSDNSVAVYWKLDISLDGDLAYQQWTSQLFGHYWMTSESRGIDYRGCVPKGLSMDASVGLLELTTSGLQFAWSQDRFFRIDGPNEDYFIKSTGKWVHDGTFQLNSSDIVTVDNVSSAIASDLSAYAMKSYVDDGFYNKTQADSLFALKANHFDKTTSDGRFAKLAGGAGQDFNVKDLIIHGQVNQWLAQQLVVEDARIQVTWKQGGAVADSGLAIYDKDAQVEVSSLVYDVDGIWRAGGDRLFTEAYNPKLGGLPAADYALKTWVENSATAYNAARLGGFPAANYPRKAENAVITGSWTIAQKDVASNAYDGVAVYLRNLNTTNFGRRSSIVFKATAADGAAISGEYSNWASANGGGSDLVFLTKNGATEASPIEKMRIRHNGDVGIGVSPTERLHVAGNGLFTGNLAAVNAALSGTLGVTGNVTAGAQLSSPTYVSGFAGSGWRLENGSETHLTVDRLTVRGRMDVYELVVNQIRGTNGALWVSDSAKVASVSGNRLTIDTGGDTSFVPFVENDLLRCQRWNGKNIKYYVVRVTAVGSNYIDVTLVNGSSPREAGDHLVRMGNTEDTDRQGALYLTSSDSNSPYMDVLDGVNSASFAGKTKVRIGRLDGITDPDLGTLSGYGLYTENGYFKGKITVTGGNAATKEDVDAVQVGGRNLLEKTNQGADGWGWGLGTSGASATVQSVVEDGVNTVKFTRNAVESSSWSYIRYNHIGRKKYEPSTEYTLSFFVKPSAYTHFTGARLQRSNGTDPIIVFGQVKIEAVAGVWNKIVFKGTSVGTLPSTTDQVVYLSGMNSGPATTYQIKDLKVEKGNRATDWTPAPEDVDAGITAAESAAKGYADGAAAAAESAAKNFATSAANAALTAAEGYTDSLKDRVEARLGLAQLEDINKTLITGNKVRTELLEVKDIVAQGIIAENVEGLELNFEQGTIGAWQIGQEALLSASELIELNAVENKIAVRHVLGSGYGVEMGDFDLTDVAQAGQNVNTAITNSDKTSGNTPQYPHFTVMAGSGGYTSVSARSSVALANTVRTRYLNSSGNFQQSPVNLTTSLSAGAMYNLRLSFYVQIWGMVAPGNAMGGEQMYRYASIPPSTAGLPQALESFWAMRNSGSQIDNLTVTVRLRSANNSTIAEQVYDFGAQYDAGMAGQIFEQIVFEKTFVAPTSAVNVVVIVNMTGASFIWAGEYYDNPGTYAIGQGTGRIDIGGSSGNLHRITILRPNTTEISSKGFQVVNSTESYFRVQEDFDQNFVEARGEQEFISPNGRYRLKVSNDGIQRSTDGGFYWSSI